MVAAPMSQGALAAAVSITRRVRGLALFAWLPYSVSCWAIFLVTVDDPLITLRYAANLVHGQGLAFNLGQHVQGFTSPLHLVVSALVYIAPGGYELLKLKFASMFFGFLAVMEGWHLVRLVIEKTWLQRVGAVTIGASGVMAAAGTNGLETSLNVWLVVLLARLLVAQRHLASPLLVAGVASVAVLARPESLLIVLTLAATSAYSERAPVVRRVLWAAGGLVAASAVAAFGLLYFHDPLPNTFYAKNQPLAQALLGGVRYFVQALQPQLTDWRLGSIDRGAATLLLFECGVILWGVLVSARGQRRCLYLVAVAGAQGVFILKSGGDWMSGGRFLAPAIIPLIILELIGASDLLGKLGQDHRPEVLTSYACLVAFGLIAASVYPFRTEFAPASAIARSPTNRLLIEGGLNQPFGTLWAAQADHVACLKPGDKIASTEVGYSGFSRLDLDIVDMRGLTNAQVAKGAPGAIKSSIGVRDPRWYEPTSPVGRILLREKPTVIMDFDTAPRGTVLGGEYRLLRTYNFLGLVEGIYVTKRNPPLCLSVLNP